MQINIIQNEENTPLAIIIAGSGPTDLNGNQPSIENYANDLTALIKYCKQNGYTVSSVPPQLNSMFNPSVQPYLISWFNYNPSELIKYLQCRTLIVQGGKDIQVDSQEAQLLKMAAPKSEFVVINQMNHMLKTIEGDIKENLASYTNPLLPVNAELVLHIVEFIN